MSNDHVRITMDRSEVQDLIELMTPAQPPIDRSMLKKNEIDALQLCMTLLCTDLTIYKQLFTERESIEALNKFNKFIFSRIQQAYIEKICLQISCLLDPPGDSKNKNLSIERFVELTKDTQLRNDFNDILSIYASSGMKKWRQKVLAHLDLQYTTGQKSIKLELSYEKIERIITRMQRIIDRLKEPGSRMDIMVQLPFNLCGTSFVERIKNSPPAPNINS